MALKFFLYIVRTTNQVKKRQLARLRASLESGFPVDSINEHGNTALMMACKVRPIMYTGPEFQHRM